MEGKTEFNFETYNNFKKEYFSVENHALRYGQAFMCDFGDILHDDV